MNDLSSITDYLFIQLLPLLPEDCQCLLLETDLKNLRDKMKGNKKTHFGKEVQILKKKAENMDFSK